MRCIKQRMTPDLPQRSRPAHLPAIEIPNRSVIIFLTVCVADRRPLLARPEVHQLLRQTWDKSQEWLVGSYVLMPDHVHLVCTPQQRDSVPLTSWVRFWKSRSTRE
jgi:putative transposase